MWLYYTDLGYVGTFPPPPPLLFLGSVLLEVSDSLGRKLRESRMRSPEENKSQ